MGDDFGSLVGPACAEEVDPSGDAGGVDSAGFADVGDAEESDFSGVEAFGDFFEAVAVSAGFHHGHERAAAEKLARDAEIVLHGREVDLGPGAGW